MSSISQKLASFRENFIINYLSRTKNEYMVNDDIFKNNTTN
ncbi:hypothetical protein GAB14E_0412 [Colwellia psychrerythraea]|uniref:Uncharacterized protein n=1 Tax=Colwellia psychrerythraea TaxID=28229 RepID=A0A099L1Z3_COLPS|nr:hypothetical protein GAB14E_0412 [Colwellia psychrerythraea]